MSESYVVNFRLSKPLRIRIAKLGLIQFRRGYYVYTGKAPKEWIAKRIARHRVKKKKLRWHIDYFSSQSSVEFLNSRVFKIKECDLADNLKKKFFFVDKFGSSDCRCRSHLFYSRDLKKIMNIIKKGKNLDI